MENPQLDAELAIINTAVKEAVAARTVWMDVHMADYAKFKIGDEIYDHDSGRKLGIVSKLYRYWAGRNPEFDTSMSVEYEFCTGGNCYDNTSRYARYTAYAFVTRDEMAKEMTDRAARLADKRTDEEKWASVFK